VQDQKNWHCPESQGRIERKQGKKVTSTEKEGERDQEIRGFNHHGCHWRGKCETEKRGQVSLARRQEEKRRESGNVPYRGENRARRRRLRYGDKEWRAIERKQWVDRNRFDANPDPDLDLDRHQEGN
jgi:hypothetical protein